VNARSDAILSICGHCVRMTLVVERTLDKAQSGASVRMLVTGERGVLLTLSYTHICLRHDECTIFDS
jgi:hypothetical protein